MAQRFRWMDALKDAVTGGRDAAPGRRRFRGADPDAAARAEPPPASAAAALAPPGHHDAELDGLFTPPPREDSITRIVLDPSSVWRSAWVVVAVVLLAMLGRFFFSDGGSVLFLLIMSFFLAMAMEPAVARLAQALPRPLATVAVMIGFALFAAVFFWQFGNLLVEQLSALVASIPSLADALLGWVNQRFGTSYTTDNLLSSMGLSTSTITDYASQLAGGLLGVVSSLAGAVVAVFALVFFTYYISAGMPGLRGWVAGLFRPRQQVVLLTVWELILTKVGGYVSARLVLAVISGTVTGIFMAVIGMPYFLPLAIWTGLVAQFVPNVGTYFSILLPVLVGAASDDPKRGLYVLVFAIAYQQVENLTIEPRISARAVDVHPAVSFASALLGASLFGVAGAALGVPVAATLIALFDIYKQRYDVTHATETAVAAVVERSIARDEEGGADADPGTDAGGERATETVVREGKDAGDGSPAPAGATALTDGPGRAGSAD